MKLNSFYNMDCLNFMRTLEDKSIDLVLTDPPYGVNIANVCEIGYKANNVFTPKNWDSAIPTAEIFNEIFRISKHQIIFGGNYFNLKPSRCFIIWDKGEGFYNRSYAECEMAWTSFDKNAKIYKRDPLANGDYKNKIHPTQKPVNVIQRILRDFSTETDIILDCFSGSGTTAIACHNLNRKFICIEKDKEYFDKSVTRYEKHIQQQSLNFAQEYKI